MGSAAVSGPPLRKAAALPRADARAVARAVVGVVIAAVAVLAGVGWL